MYTSLFSIFDCVLDLRYQSRRIHDLLAANFGAMAYAGPVPSLRGHLSFEVRECQGDVWEIVDTDNNATPVAGPGDLLFHLEQKIVVALQKARPDLYFLHSAVVERYGKGYLLVAESGRGKSTTTWLLLHHGFKYITDELAAIDLQTMRVYGYPHALCLKHEPSAPYAAPDTVLNLEDSLRIPVHGLPAAVGYAQPRSIGAIFVVDYQPGRLVPAIKPLSGAEASAWIYLNALNALSHPVRGLDAALRIATAAPCFALSPGGFDATADLLNDRVSMPHVWFGERPPTILLGSL